MIEKLSTEEICPQCGKKVNPGSKFCIYCGAALEAPAEQPEEKAEVKVCKTCGKPLEGRCILYKLWNKNRRR